MESAVNIIKAIDTELIQSEKDCLSLAQANTLLIRHSMMTKVERSNGELKRLLENGEIPHAYQTTEKPRQWFIPLSHRGRTEKKKAETKYTKIENPNQKKLPVGCAFFSGLIIVFLLAVFLFSDSESSRVTYYANRTTYAATSKAAYNDMFQYALDNDNEALSLLMIQGELVLIREETELYLIETDGLGTGIFRKKGSTQQLWFSTDFVDKK
ncbi:hypothetical protein Oweho_0478 [Owenweeksia hongkongensis DSM 17368]|uniref:Uncharacterized protein n=1 Tax=Owenweeksia hongkongensis (strain DSM 17368 / CIP 108786 / JCM 12287 / NRRL B-23963 / UST20020801) TaxID=926562 RepID=G8QZQ2_OWEHD|nr:hypothetical protein [Owenweeksia hongkongensis]AEV31496.1 hypothetical protein Oweho_0478 [Owenweeksia hongkongensis DSM 17368]